MAWSRERVKEIVMNLAPAQRWKIERKEEKQNKRKNDFTQRERIRKRKKNI